MGIGPKGRALGNAERGGEAAARRADLNRRLRAAFVEGAEEDTRRRLGRGPDAGGA
jgi:hypothetical protein